MNQEAIDLYRNDPRFHALVDTLVALDRDDFPLSRATMAIEIAATIIESEKAKTP